MAWISGSLEFPQPGKSQRDFEGNIIIKKVDEVIFHGVVLEHSSNTPIPGALVRISARLAGGQETALGLTYSGSDGNYLIAVDKGKIPADAAAIVIRSGPGE